MRVARLQDVAAVVLQQDVFPIIDVALGLAVRDLFDAPPQAVVAIRARRKGRWITGGKLLHLRQPILRVIRVLRKVPGGEQRLARKIAVVIVLIAVGRIGGELIPGVRHIPRRRAIPDGIVGEGLRRGEPGW